MSDLHCPCCRSKLDLAVLFACASDRSAIEQLVSIGLPMGDLVLQYLMLHTPPKQCLSSAKQIKLIRLLLPDLRREAIKRGGQDRPVPHAIWAKALADILLRRDTLELPLKGHGYLYSMLAGMAEKADAAQEAQTEAARRAAPPAAPVTVRGQPKSIADALAGAGATPNAPIPPAPPPGPRTESPTVRRMKAELAAKKPTNEGK